VVAVSPGLRRVATAVVVTMGLTACGSDTPSMLDPKGDEADKIARTWWIMFGLAIGVYVLVATFIVIAVLRGRRTERGRPSRLTDGSFVWFGGIVMPVVVLLVIAVLTVTTTAALRKPSRSALHVQIVGHDWWWDVRYPGTSIRVANEFHLPVGTPIEIRLTSADVIHSFWVPQIGGKVDLIPGQPNEFRFTITKPGLYRGQCAEYCGLQHANMALYVHADPPGLYERWVAAHRDPPSEPASELAAQGAMAFQAQACAGCHTVRGTQAQGTRGPNLTDFGSRRSIGAGTIANTPSRLARWMVNAQQFKPGAHMPPISLSSGDVDAIVAYLESLK
jgi:cytochrome c oxidase subunit II